MDLVEAAFTEWVAPNRRFMERLGRLPFFYGLMRVLVKPMMRRTLPAAGWETEWVEISGNVLAFNMTRCFYLDVLEGYGVPELTALYCKMDDLIYEDVSPYVKWDRKRTLGRGDECCDFRYERVRRGDSESLPGQVASASARTGGGRGRPLIASLPRDSGLAAAGFDGTLACMQR